MDFDDVILLGDGLPDDLDDTVRTQHRSDRSDGARLNLTVGLTVSIFIHLLLGFVFQRLSLDSSGRFTTAPPTVVQIRFLPIAESPIPTNAEVEELVVEATPELDESLSVEELIEEQIPAPAEPPVELLRLAPQIAEETAADEDSTTAANQPATQEKPFELPSAVAVRQILESQQSARLSRFYARDCNPLEDDTKIRDCQPQDHRDYAPVEANVVYSYYNPPRERSRSRETLTAVQLESTALRARLLNSDIPSGLGAYLNAEIEAGISVYSDTENKVVQHLSSLGPRSYAEIQTERIFDHWVRNQTRLLRERRYFTRQAAEAEQACTSFKIFDLAPREFIECLSMGSISR